jgi:hypothetical protein
MRTALQYWCACARMTTWPGKPRAAKCKCKRNMFSSFRCWGIALFKGVSEKNLQQWKVCGRSSPPRCLNYFESALGLVDESSTSKYQSGYAEHSCSGKAERKKSLSLGPIALPSALESALDQAMSSKSFSCVHVLKSMHSTELQIEIYYWSLVCLFNVLSWSIGFVCATVCHVRTLILLNDGLNICVK